ncbi:hypothetical protein PP290_gp01 [Aeromonas phage pAEv1818]|uniref:hypothetical protein n=1 Tax=Aeromonas phage pAEv1818 TaxID=2908746 RepID=UPI00232937DB|nr:hypothetical protein PP290_gp01 [Aeromonas phage pAEv1818]UIS24885.1 hypothetical protein pAEv1818_1 [Aeromonas phage pAEv1818]
MKNFIIVIASFVIVAVGFGFIESNSPSGKEKSQARDAIKLCKEDNARNSLDDNSKRFVAETCEKMEASFKRKYGVNP